MLDFCIMCLKTFLPSCMFTQPSLTRASFLSQFFLSVLNSPLFHTVCACAYSRLCNEQVIVSGQSWPSISICYCLVMHTQISFLIFSLRKSALFTAFLILSRILWTHSYQFLHCARMFRCLKFVWEQWHLETQWIKNYHSNSCATHITSLASTFLSVSSFDIRVYVSIFIYIYIYNYLSHLWNLRLDYRFIVIITAPIICRQCPLERHAGVLMPSLSYIYPCFEVNRDSP